MPYTLHPKINLPEDKERKVWRYMDFEKFESLINESSLYFPRLSQLTDYDELEGILSKKTVERLRDRHNKHSGFEAEEIKKYTEKQFKVLRMQRETLLVSSWHINENESLAMWNIYSKRNKGIAIQSTISDLIESFHPDERDIYIGQINYIDYNVDETPFNYVFYPALHKTKNYDYERELRAIIIHGEGGSGDLIKVDLDKLINCIYISPKSEISLQDNVVKLLQRYGLKKDLIRSDLEQKPLY